MWRIGWIFVGTWIYTIPRTARQGVEVGGGKAQSFGKATSLRERGPEDIWQIWCASKHAILQCRTWKRDTWRSEWHPIGPSGKHAKVGIVMWASARQLLTNCLVVLRTVSVAHSSHRDNDARAGAKVPARARTGNLVKCAGMA